MKYIIFPWKSKKEYKIIKNSLFHLNSSVLKSEEHVFGKHNIIEKLIYKYRHELENDNIKTLPDYKACREIKTFEEELNRSRNERFETCLYSVIFISVFIFANGFFIELIFEKYSDTTSS